MKKGKDMGITACKRIKALAKEIGADMNYRHGWQAHASRCMGLNYRTTWAILNNPDKTKVHTKTISAVSRAIGLTPNELMQG